MSYAAAVAKGGPQAPEDAAAPQVDSVIPETESVHLIDVDSGVSVVSSDFPDQAVKTQTQADRIDIEKAVAAEEDEARQKAAAARSKAKAKGKEAAGEIQEFFKDPVNATNAICNTILVVFLGVAGWRKWKAGQLTWKVIGITTAGIAAYSTANFFASQWASDYISKNKKKK